MASMLNMMPTSGSSSIQTHYKTAYGPGSFPSSFPLTSQNTKNFSSHNSNMDNNNNSGGGSRIKVAVRVRPLLQTEKQQGHQCTILRYQNNNEIQIGADDNGGGGVRAKSFKFDQVFTNESSQSDLYSGLGIQNLVTKVIEGYHSTIFAYGQTGSGKTFTMEGYDFVQNFGGDSPNKTKAVKASNDSENIGITQRSIFELFNQIKTLKNNEQSQGSSSGSSGHVPQQQKHFSVFCSFLQIYNEKVFDLLNSSSINSLGSKKVGGGGVGNGGNNNNNSSTNANGGNAALELQKQMQGLRIRWTKKDQFVVENLYVFECQTPEEAIELFRFGSKNRVLASHNLNDLSSRSHTIFTLTVEQQDLRHAGESMTVSKLQLVDLAGSEKQGLTGTTGQQAKESIDINKSLLVLRKVITALTEQKGGGNGFAGGSALNGDSKLSCMGGGGGGGFIPYRESKLTCLLKQSLGGNSYTLMIACLSPSDRYLEENLSTLNYAAKASLISNIPTKNIDPRLIELNEYKKKIQDLEKELRNANDHIQFLTQMNDDKAKKLLVFETQLKLQSNSSQTSSGAYQDNNNYQDTGASKLPSISSKNQSSTNSNSVAHHIKQLRSEIISKEDVSYMIGIDNHGGINLTQNDIDLSSSHNNTSGLRSIISPNKSVYNSGLQNQMSNSALSSNGNNPQSTTSNQLNTKRQTQMNFFLQKDKEKQDAAAERLIHSVNAVTDLLKANTELRETIEKLKNSKEEVDGENFTLQIENQSLRERLELVEGILKNNRSEYDGMVSDQVKDKMQVSNTQYGKFNMNATMDQPPTTIDAVYTELIQLRHKNKALEGRIKQLEIQNFRMTNSGFNKNSNAVQKAYQNQEPLRPMFNNNKGQSSVETTPLNSDRQQQQYVQEEDNEEDDNDDYDDEDNESADDQHYNNNYNNRTGHQHQQKSSKSRSFIVTIDEHNPNKHMIQQNNTTTGLIKKRIIKKSVLLDKAKKQVNQTQIVMARGDPYLKRLTLAQNSTPNKSRDQNTNNIIQNLPSSQSKNTQQLQQISVPDQRYYTKTNFYTVNNNTQQLDDINPRTYYNQSAFDQNTTNFNNSNMGADVGNYTESVGAVQPPKNMLNQTTTSNLQQQCGNNNNNGGGNSNYESDYNTSVNDMNRRQRGVMQLEPITEMKNVTDVEFKNYQKNKKKQMQMQQQAIKANQREQLGNNTKGDLSMVVVMSNLMSKRSGANIMGQSTTVKKKSQSQSATNNKKNKYSNNEFYF